GLTTGVLEILLLPAFLLSLILGLGLVRLLKKSSSSSEASTTNPLVTTRRSLLRVVEVWIFVDDRRTPFIDFVVLGVLIRSGGGGGVSSKITSGGSSDLTGVLDTTDDSILRRLDC